MAWPRRAPASDLRRPEPIGIGCIKALYQALITRDAGAYLALLTLAVATGLAWTLVDA